HPCQRRADPRQRVTSGADDGIKIQEAVKLACVMQELHRNARGTQLRGIAESIVPNRIEAGREDQRWRQSTQIRTEPRRKRGIRWILALLDERSQGIQEIGAYEIALRILGL